MVNDVVVHCGKLCIGASLLLCPFDLLENLLKESNDGREFAFVFHYKYVHVYNLV